MKKLAWVVGWFLITLTGCNDHVLSKVQSRDPEILVHPEILDFGRLLSGYESQVETFAIINVGDETLLLDPPELIDGSKRFSMSWDETLEIEAGEFVDIEVYYTPETYESNGAIVEVVSNDEDEPEVVVLLQGGGDAPVMTVFPEEFDYGTISMGCDNEERITIRNDGNLDLTVDNISQMVTQPPDIIMEFGSLPPPPWQLLPNQEVDFLVSYIPSDTGVDDSSITITGNDPQTPDVDVLQYGEGIFEQWIIQTHVQEEIPILDIIFVIDNSGSMNLFQQELANQMTTFMNVFVSSNSDYHLGFVTTDRGYLQGAGSVYWIDKTFATPVDWAQGVITAIGVHGASYEKGIEYAKNVLENTDSIKGAAPGTPFWRDDATLVIIYVSDEPDFSMGTWVAYTNFFDAIKPSVDMVRHFGVIGDYPSGCTWTSSHGYFRTVAFGSGYWDMTQRYNGDWYSICASDWGQQMQDLADTVTVHRSFSLDEPDPIIDTIEVTVNGQSATGWEYDPNTNSVIFADDSIPQPNQTIIIEYAVWGC